jgi:aerobic carbon-monoxide dehydrogenase large subunit
VLFNAVNDALQGLGVELSETPLTPRRLLTAIERASHRSSASAAVAGETRR